MICLSNSLLSLAQVPGTPSPTEPSKDDALRLRLKDDLKTAMKSKDTMSSTVIRVRHITAKRVNLIFLSYSQ